MLQFEPPCNHKEGRYRCCSIPAFYLIQQRKRVLNHHDKLQQDRLLGSMMSVSVPKRRRPRKDGEKLNSMFIRYQVRVHDETLPVCCKFFRTLFSIGQSRANSIAKSVMSCKPITERRGGDRKSKLYAEKKQSVINFLSKLKARESHYSRGKSKRLYLASELNINRLHKMYNAEVPHSLKVKNSFL